MGFMDVKCKCGCGKRVQRGSRYFLDQGLGLKFGIEVIDVYYNNYLTRINELADGVDADADLTITKSIRSQCVQMSESMLKVAHYGPSGLQFSRSEVEKVNWNIVHFIWRIEDLNLPELVNLRTHERMSRPQKKIYKILNDSFKPQ